MGSDEAGGYLDDDEEVSVILYHNIEDDIRQNWVFNEDGSVSPQEARSLMLAWADSVLCLVNWTNTTHKIRTKLGKKKAIVLSDRIFEKNPAVLKWAKLGSEDNAIYVHFVNVQGMKDTYTIRIKDPFSNCCFNCEESNYEVGTLIEILYCTEETSSWFKKNPDGTISPHMQSEMVWGIINDN